MCFITFETTDFHKRQCDRIHCMKCHRVFKVTTPYQLFCSDKCAKEDEQIKLELDSRSNGKCSICNKAIRISGQIRSDATCYACQYAKTHKAKIYDNTKEIVIRKGVSLKELNRRAEYMRIMDEKFACRYIRGKR